MTVATRIHKFQEIHGKVNQHMKTYSEEVKQQQHKHVKPITFKVGNLVMDSIHQPEGNSNKLLPKFTGPYRIMELPGGNNFKIQHVYTGETQIRQMNSTSNGNTKRSQTKKFKVLPSAGKLMCIIVYDTEGVVFIDCMPHNNHRSLLG